jgi:hypothetical protein
MSSLTLDLPQVAAALSMKPAAFIRRRPRLQREHGFPRALPGCGPVWSSWQVEAWIRAGGVPAPAEEPPPPAARGAQAIIDAARQNLEARYLGERR